MRGKTLQRLDDGGGIVDRKRGLRHVRQILVVADCETLDVGHRLDEMGATAALSHRPFHLRMAGVADHHDRASVLAHPRHFDMDFGDEGARRIEHPQSARLGVGAHGAGDAVRREHDGASGRNLVQLLDEHRAFRLQVVDDEAVMNDFMAHVDRRAELRERLLDDRDRAVDTGTETARVREDDIHQFPLSDGTRGGSAARRWRKLSTIKSAAPTQIALSATLNAGHDQRS